MHGSLVLHTAAASRYRVPARLLADAVVKCDLKLLPHPVNFSAESFCACENWRRHRATPRRCAADMPVSLSGFLHMQILIMSDWQKRDYTHHSNFAAAIRGYTNEANVSFSLIFKEYFKYLMFKLKMSKNKLI